MQIVTVLLILCDSVLIVNENTQCKNTLNASDKSCLNLFTKMKKEHCQCSADSELNYLQN